MRWLAVVLSVAQCLQIVLTARILAICTVASHSHSLWCYRYMVVLAERGHQVTVLGVDKPKIHVPNMTTYIAEGVYEAVHSEENIVEYNAMSQSMIHTLRGHLLWLRVAAETVLKSKALTDLIDHHKDVEKPFDLIIHDHGSCAGSLLGLVPLFGNPPLILATTYGSPQWMTYPTGFNPAYVSNMMAKFKPNMSFYERFLNTYYEVVTMWFTRYRFEQNQEDLKSKVFGEGLPHVRDLAKQANVVIVNYHPAFDGARPMLPGTVGIAGLHIGEPKPLPQDIKDFMDGAEDGVILLSFGSNVDSTWFTKDFEIIVASALEQLPQRVLWKWDKTPAKVPANVKISRWLPQADMMVHPRMRLFITHCGLLSTQEAIYRKVPVLALPVFIDQLDIAAALVQRNLTIQLDVHSMTSAQLRDGIREIINNPMYKSNIEQLGELMRDMPLTASQQAVYWTEYVIKHDGATHLHSAAVDMPWYQLFSLDVIGLVLIVALMFFWLVKIALKLILAFCFSKIKNKSD